MSQTTNNPLQRDLTTTIKQGSQSQRLQCSFCNYCIDASDSSLLTPFPCNTRAFKDEIFHVWRCPQCQNLHCLEVVDLDFYYRQYPVVDAVSSGFNRSCFKNILRRFQKHGLTKSHSFLDYGCGGNGLFVTYLQELGFTHSYGYDPYSPQTQFNDPEILQQGPFDYILLQDVIEHVEDAQALLKQMDHLLAPGGYILIGTPNASRIDLTKSHLPEYYNEVHLPYHLCMYTPESLEKLGNVQKWHMVDFFERPFHDLVLGVNSRSWNQYVRRLDGCVDVIYEPVNIWKAITSWRVLFYSIFGYWLSFRTNMSIMFYKN
jgi:SAM-dependent methyltransferase